MPNHPLSTSNSHLSDDAANHEIKKMISFIKQESLEKAKELQVKANEEFQVEKAKLVRQHTLYSDIIHTKRLKAIEVQQKIVKSKELNKQKLQILHQKTALIHQLKAECFERLQQQLSSLEFDGYRKFLIFTLNQCVDQLKNQQCSLSPTKTVILVECREQDCELVQQIIDQQQYPVKLVLQATRYLPQSTGGGVVCSIMGQSQQPTKTSTGDNNGGKIRVVNTVEERLNISLNYLLPQLTKLIFPTHLSKIKLTNNH